MLAAGSIFDPLYHAIGWLLAVLYVPTHSLGLAIVVMTLIVMAVQLPLIAKQTRSMIVMQRVQPEIKKIQQKYKDDRQKQNEELLKFYEGKIAKWQVPDDVVFVDAIPLGATGKMLKTRLREQLKDYRLPTA